MNFNYITYETYPVVIGKKRAVHFSYTRKDGKQNKSTYDECCLISFTIGSPTKPLCEDHHPMIHVNVTAEISKDTEVLITDAEIEACDVLLGVTPPLHCPLPPTYSGSWIEDKSNILKIIHKV